MRLGQDEDNGYADTADYEHLKKLARDRGISPSIATKALGIGKFDVDLIYGKYYLKVILFVQNFDKIEYLKEHIEGMIPCNIILDLMVIYNQYKLFKRLTYKDLKSMTHKYMRQHYFEETG